MISNYDVAEVLSSLLGRIITYRELTFDETKSAMVSAGVPEAIAEQNAQAFSLTAEGDAGWVSDDVATILGRAAHSFEQFAADYAPRSRSPHWAHTVSGRLVRPLAKVRLVRF